MKFKFKKSDRKIIAVIFILVILLVIVSMIEYDYKNKPKNVIEEGESTVATKQSLIIHSLVRLLDVDIVFNMTEDNNIGYQIKDKLESFMQDYVKDKTWHVVDAQKTEDEYIIMLKGDTFREEVVATLDKDIKIKSFTLDGNELITEENINEINKDPEYEVIFD